MVLFSRLNTVLATKNAIGLRTDTDSHVGRKSGGHVARTADRELTLLFVAERDLNDASFEKRKGGCRHIFPWEKQYSVIFMVLNYL